ncbi:universal stress protein [Noviherbaspirillum aerium]|uniref:universal stress protein n=1 Tax=Noviherbaspirillum aerium TaxID=2588497 RepID=UPI00124DF90E|nr:universal stress protein [Noviherbaspirillum aerium]
MSYKTILVHADHSPHLVQRVRAASLAGNNINTHIVGVAVTGVSHYLRLSERTRQQGGQVTDAWHEEVGRLHKSAEAALARFEDAARAAGLQSFECRLVADDELDGLSLHARYSDLTILTQWDAEAPAHPMADDLPEYVAVSSGRPVLVLPHRHEIEVLADNPLLAWDGSLEATRAVHHALPLLERAGKVDVLILRHGRKPTASNDVAGADIVPYLAHHDIAANVIQERDSHSDIGGALLACCDTAQSDLLVMGCYGHSRFQEMLRGGVTLTVLEKMTIPVLMAH